MYETPEPNLNNEPTTYLRELQNNTHTSEQKLSNSYSLSQTSEYNEPDNSEY